MSSGVDARGIGYSEVIVWIRSSDIHARSQRVSIGPGQTAFTRMGAIARANDLVIVLRAPLLAQYAIDEPNPLIAATELTFTTAARSDLFNSGTAARVTKNGPFRFTAKMR